MVVMTAGNKLIFSLIFVLLAACSARENDLDRMRVNGDVEKIETVALTTIPIMEYHLNIDPREGIANPDGNYILTFNSKGNIKRYQGFGCDQEELFDVSPKRGERVQGVALFSDIPLDEIFDSVAYELNENGDVTLMEWYEGEKLSRRTAITYDAHKRPAMCVANSGYLGDWGTGEIFLRHDTTIFTYTKTDGNDNWTEMKVDRRSGLMPERNNISYRVLRQITYRGEREKKPLMQQAEVRKYYEEQSRLTTHTHHTVRLGNIATISVPTYMTATDAAALKDFMKETGGDPLVLNGDLCRYENIGKYFASFSVSYFADAATGWDELTDDDKVFDQEFDDVWRTQYETPEAQKMISLLKWYPYSFVTIDGHCAILTRYIRYGKGTLIPVYVESYLLDTPDGGAINITMSYQINQRRYFHQDFVNSVYSFRLK